MFRKTGRLIPLSEQNLLDCVGFNVTHGCSGGFLQHAFQYVKDSGGLATEKSCPYKGQVSGIPVLLPVQLRLWKAEQLQSHWLSSNSLCYWFVFLLLENCMHAYNVLWPNPYHSFAANSSCVTPKHFSFPTSWALLLISPSPHHTPCVQDRTIYWSVSKLSDHIPKKTLFSYSSSQLPIVHS